MAHSNLKKLYIIRHGETDYNQRGMVQGSGIDAPLNETGRAQADRFYQAYAKKHFDKAYVSNLQRTYQSIEAFIRDGLSYEKLAGLNEISWGSQEGKPFNEHTSKLYHETVKSWSNGDLTVGVGGGETPLQVEARQREAMAIIMSRPEEKEVLICMHGRAIRILMSWLTGRPIARMDEFQHTNLGLYEVHAIGGQFQIVRENDTTHLEG